MPATDAIPLSLLFDRPSAQDADRYVVQLGGQPVEYRLRRGARRRNITLTIDDRGLRVGAPLRASQRRIESVLNQHAGWIIKRLAEWNKRRPAPFVWTAGSQLMFLGQALTLALDPLRADPIHSGDKLWLPGHADAKALARTTIEWLQIGRAHV